MTLFLIRHGQDEDGAQGLINGQRDTNLTAMGYEQAALAAHQLLDKGVTAIYTSPLQRARETAAIISSRLGENPGAALEFY